jgi:hypothetical protein
MNCAAPCDNRPIARAISMKHDWRSESARRIGGAPIMDYISIEGAIAPGAKRAQWNLTRSAKAPGPETRLVGMAAAADMLGISRGYFYLAVLPQLKTIRFGKRQVVEVAEIDRFIALKRADAAGPTPEQIKAAEAVGVTPEQINAVDDMVERRMQNSGETRATARAAIADVLHSMVAEAEAKAAGGRCAVPKPWKG